LLARKYTLISGHAVLRGTLMGVITASGKVVPSLSAAGDGSQTPFGIAAVDADSTLGPSSPPADRQIDVFVRGSFNENKVILGTAHTIASVREALRGKGIFLETPVKRFP
jgi:Bacteriophage lambda head decoration protein D